MKKIIISSFLFLACISSYAQNYSTGYFLENFVYGYRFNPAIQAEKNFIGIAIGNANETAMSNLGLESVLFSGPDGSLVTGLHESVAADKFLDGLPENATVFNDLNYNFLSLGSRQNEKVYHTFEINVRSLVNTNMPKELLSCLKIGFPGAVSYDISGTNLSTRDYAEVIYGYSRKTSERFSFGIRLKFLLGFASANAGFQNGIVSSTSGQITMTLNGQVQAAIAGFGCATKESQYTPGIQVYDYKHLLLNTMAMGPSGFGGAADLGVEWKPFKGFTASLSVLDLGGLSWKYNFAGNTTQSTIGIGLNQEITTGSKIDFKSQIDKIMQVTEFIPGEEFSEFEMIPYTVNLGVKYKLPVKIISFGAAASYHHYTTYFNYFDARVGATLTPVKWFSVTGNIGGGTFGGSYGAALAVNLGPLAIHAGIESYLGRVTSGLYPLPLEKFRETANLGLVLQFGKRNKE